MTNAHKVHIEQRKTKWVEARDGDRLRVPRIRIPQPPHWEHPYRLEDWVQEGQKKFPKAMEKFKLYVSKRDEKGVPELVRKEVKMMLYNNRDMIEEIKDE